MDPVEIEGTAATGCAPNRITDPLPNCFSIWARVAPKARLRSFSSMCGVSSFLGRNLNYIAPKHFRPDDDPSGLRCCALKLRAPDAVAPGNDAMRRAACDNEPGSRSSGP